MARIFISTYGSRGDVQPYIALGTGFKTRAAELGDRVRGEVGVQKPLISSESVCRLGIDRCLLSTIDSMRKKLYVLVMLLALVGTALGETEKSASQLLDEIMETPGSWSQGCFMVVANIPKGEIPLGGYSRTWPSDKISAKSFTLLRARRGDVVAEVGRRIEQELPDFLALLENGREDVSDERLETYLLVLTDLNGVEELPALLKLESSLAARTPYKEEGKYSRYPMHIQTLSTITAILKAEKYTKIPSGAAVFSKKMRGKIVGLARFYLANTDPADFKAAKGMSKEPITR